MDLSTLAPVEDSVEIEVRHPVTGVALMSAEDEPVTIAIFGADSPVFQARQKASINKRLHQNSRKVAVTAEGLEEDAINTLAACIAGWKNIDLDGKALPFSRESAKALLTRLRWLRDQIDEAVADRANFLKASA